MIKQIQCNVNGRNFSVYLNFSHNKIFGGKIHKEHRQIQIRDRNTLNIERQK